MPRPVVVLGAGIQGVCVSLMLARRGRRVLLFDKCSQIMNRTSLSYEGRIHAGFIYGLDGSGRTARRMLVDAFHFAPYLESLLEESLDWTQLRSCASDYLVVRDSLLSSREIERHYLRLQAEAMEILRNRSLHYLGERPERIFERTAVPQYCNPVEVVAGFRTIERSVNQLALREKFQARLSSDQRIELCLDRELVDIEAQGPEYLLSFVDRSNTEGDVQRVRASQVFNCLWESQASFDARIGLERPLPSMRLKYGLIVELDDFLRGLRSFSLVAGRYGSFVSDHHSNSAFMAWYPACLKGLSQYGPLPEVWDRAANGEVSQELSEELTRNNIVHFQTYLPELCDLRVQRIKGGIILAPAGRTLTKDINKRESTLHDRSEPALFSKGGYISVNTGKYTSAPRNTLLLEQQLF